MLAAEAAFATLHRASKMDVYWDSLQSSWIWEELYRARNYRPVSICFLVFTSLFF